MTLSVSRARSCQLESHGSLVVAELLLLLLQRVAGEPHCLLCAVCSVPAVACC
jgi:hypothetical protein